MQHIMSDRIFVCGKYNYQVAIHMAHYS